ncbi:site-specific integrase [Pedobacter sp. ASV28]|uniref:site-specific integrase n=1 Tax=Pedobacter sp. ASV28 TaxID=2795123 RepID=UPI0018EA44E0|nr:site-specific integrase [Pedobacter sp. ASV28]
MKTKNSTFGVLFYLKKQKTTAKGTAPICARITVNGRRTEISVKRSISVSQWDAKKGLAKGSRKEVVEFNMFLDQFKAKIINTYQQMLVTGADIHGEAIRDKVLGKAQLGQTIESLIDFHNQHQKAILAQGTMKNYYTTQRYLSRFLRDRYGRCDMRLSELDYKFIVGFENYLLNSEPKDHQKPLRNNGVMKHIERLRKMVSIAIKLGWIPKDPFGNFKKHFDKVERKPLTADELGRLSKRQFEIERLKHVRDMFLFSCYTGLAYIDLAQLRPDNIVIGINGGLWLSTCREKTETTVSVPLLPQARELMDKYKGDPRSVNKGTVFPVISNQRMNGYLKEIADICGIRKKLTFHTARHTFATTITLSNGVPIESVSKMLGHTSIRTTQIYAKVVELKLSEDMQNLERRISGAGS